jgi:hypothetical protein
MEEELKPLLILVVMSIYQLFLWTSLGYFNGPHYSFDLS